MSVADFAQVTALNASGGLPAALHGVNLGDKSWGSRASPAPSRSRHSRQLRSHPRGQPCPRTRSLHRDRSSPHGHTHSLTCALPLSCLSQPQALHLRTTTPHSTTPPHPLPQYRPSAPEMKGAFPTHEKRLLLIFKNILRIFKIFFDEPQKGRGSGPLMAQTLRPC